MKAIEYFAFFAEESEALRFFGLLAKTPQAFGLRKRQTPQGHDVICYFPLGEVDERAELAQGYRVVTLPAHLPWPQPPACP